MEPPIYRAPPQGHWENSMRLFRSFLSVLAVLAVFAMVAGDADARPRISAGSRGTRTYSAPTPTTPNAASPITRSTTQPGQGGINTASPPVSRPGGLFGGFGRGLAGGLL